MSCGTPSTTACSTQTARLPRVPLRGRERPPQAHARRRPPRQRPRRRRPPERRRRPRRPTRKEREMSNVKRVRIKGELPFNFMDGEEMGGTLSDSDIAFLARCLMGKHGLKLRWLPGGRIIPNAKGGKTTYDRFQITGEEALRWETLDLLADTLEKAGAILQDAAAKDIEDVPSLTYSIGGKKS